MNKNLKVNSIRVKAFRGISIEQTLDLNNVTVIYGENGTGKSSFVNAFEYLFSNKLYCLKEQTIEKAFAHKDFKKEDIEIELKFKGKKKLNLSPASKENLFFKDILENFYVKNASFILTRSKLLNFVNGTRKNRYDALTDLCGFDQLNKYREIINNKNNSIKRAKEERESKYSERLKDLSSTLSLDGSSDSDQCLEKLNSLLNEYHFDSVDMNTDYSKYLESFSFNPKKDEIGDLINQFNITYGKLNLNDMSSDIYELLKSYERIASDNLKSTNLLLNSLDYSYKYIESESSDKCPICNSDIDSSKVLAEIDERISTLKENLDDLKTWSEKLDKIKNGILSLILHLGELEKINSEINELGDTNEILDFNNEKNSLNQLIKDLEDLKNSKILMSEINSFDFSSIDEKTDSRLDDFKEYKSKNADNEKLTIIYQSLQILRDMGSIDEEISNLTKQFDLSSNILKKFEESRKEFLANIIENIKKDVKHYFSLIHGNDEINDPDIELTKDKGIDVFLDSFGKKVDSRSFASEGHLDTLGLCIFLAFNKEFNALPLIILDDVVATVDGPHRMRIAELIVNELSDNQIIITTHSKLWAEQLKRTASAYKVPNRLYEIIDWSSDEGPILSKPLNTEEKIKKYLSPEDLDLNAAGNAARRYFEYCLKEICKINEVKVPIEDKYSVGPLFDNAKLAIPTMLEETKLKKYYEDLFAEMDSVRDIANLLSHDNDEFYELTKNDVKAFCCSVLKFKRAFTCYCGKGFIKFDSKSKRVICTHKKCQDSISMDDSVLVDKIINIGEE